MLAQCRTQTMVNRLSFDVIKSIGRVLKKNFMILKKELLFDQLAVH